MKKLAEINRESNRGDQSAHQASKYHEPRGALIYRVSTGERMTSADGKEGSGGAESTLALAYIGGSRGEESMTVLHWRVAPARVPAELSKVTASRQPWDSLPSLRFALALLVGPATATNRARIINSSFLPRGERSQIRMDIPVNNRSRGYVIAESGYIYMRQNPVKITREWQ